MILQLMPKMNNTKYDKLDKFNKFRPLKVNVIDFNKNKLNQNFQVSRQLTLENKNQTQVHIKTRIKTFYKDNRRKLKQKLSAKMFPDDKQTSQDCFTQGEYYFNLRSKSRSNLKSRSKERAKTDDTKPSEHYKKFLQGEDFIHNDKMNTKNNPCLHIRRLQKKVCSISNKQQQSQFKKSYSSKFRLAIRKNKYSFGQRKNEMEDVIIINAKKYSFGDDNLGPWQQHQQAVYNQFNE